MSDGFLGDRMHYAITVFFNVNKGARVLFVMLSKQVRDSAGWGICETKADDVVQGLAGNIARSWISDESGGASWSCG